MMSLRLPPAARSERAMTPAQVWMSLRV